MAKCFAVDYWIRARYFSGADSKEEAINEGKEMLLTMFDPDLEEGVDFKLEKVTELEDE